MDAPNSPDALRSYLFDQFVPRQRLDFVDARGGFHERLTASGAPLPALPRRLLVQCRQVYLYSHAALIDPAGDHLTAARHGFEFLRHYRDTDKGGWFFQVSSDGEPGDLHKDLYGHAFVLFALAHYLRASESAEAAQWLAETLAVIELRFGDPEHGGYHEAAEHDWTPRAGVRRQNPHMHLLEGLLACHQAGLTGALEPATRLVELAQARFVRSDTGTLGEYFTDDWRPDPERGHLVEPGHHCEWAWLLDWYHRISQNPAALTLADALLASCWRHGRDPDHGGLFDAIDHTGRVVDRHQRIWPQAEAIKAATVTAARTGDALWLTRRDQQLAHLFRHYLKPNGRWIEHLDPQLQPAVEELPGTTGYHLFLALAEVLAGR